MHLIQEVHELRVRCIDAERSNDELKAIIKSLAENNSESGSRAHAINGNLTGYASSDTSSAGKSNAPRDSI